MNNIILLTEKDKKKLNTFMGNHPFSSIFLYPELKRERSEGVSHIAVTDKRDNIISTLSDFDSGITMLSGSSTCFSLFNPIIEDLTGNFILFRKYNDYPDNINILKEEALMIYRGENPPETTSASEISTYTSDIDDLLSLKLQYEEEYWGYSTDTNHKQQFHEILLEKVKKGQIFFIRRDGFPIASGMIEISTDKISLLGSIFVMPEYRGKGLGKDITSKMTENILKKSKVPALTVDRKNTPAFRLYGKLGFREYGTICLGEIL